jgi:iron only hydrogenase large subunit-like protein
MLKAGFYDVYEVAQGADSTTKKEAAEFVERMHEGEPFMTTSCCAGYNNFIAKHLPEIKQFVSDTKTPMYYTAEIVKEKHPDAILVFISPCVAKRKEVQQNENVDYVLNADELGAIFVGKNIEIMAMEDAQYDYDSSKQARNFGVSGGVANAVNTVVEDKELVKPCIIDGLTKDSIKQLKKYAKDGCCADGNLVEVMCCEGGCIGGNSNISNPKIAKKLINNLLEKSNDIK